MRLRLILAASVLYLIVFFSVLLVKNFFNTSNSNKNLIFQESVRTQAAYDCDETYQIYKSSDVNWQFIRSDGPADFTFSSGIFYNRDQLIFIEECLTGQLESISQISSNYFKCIGIQHAEGVGRSKSFLQSVMYFEEAANRGDMQSDVYANWIKALINYDLWKLKLSPKYKLDNYSICSNTRDSRLSKLIGDIAYHQTDYLLSNACKARTEHLNRPLEICKKANKLFETGYPAQTREIYSLWRESFELGGYSSALVNMGLLREISYGGFQDKKLSYQYYKKAYELGNLYGMRHLAKLIENGSKDEPLHVRQLYERAAYLGDFYSMQKLGYSNPNSFVTIMRVH